MHLPALLEAVGFHCVYILTSKLHYPTSAFAFAVYLSTNRMYRVSRVIVIAVVCYVRCCCFCCCVVVVVVSEGGDGGGIVVCWCYSLRSLGYSVGVRNWCTHLITFISKALHWCSFHVRNIYDIINSMYL